MKRKEMMKQASEILEKSGNKYSVFYDENETFITINGYSTAFIDEETQYSFGIATEIYNRFLNKEQREKLYKVLTEYTFTPIEEREEEPQYQYFIPKAKGMNMDEYIETRLCLNYDINYNVWTWGTDEDTEDYQTIFTHKELKELGVDPKELQQKYNQVRVN